MKKGVAGIAGPRVINGVVVLARHPLHSERGEAGHTVPVAGEVQRSDHGNTNASTLLSWHTKWFPNSNK